VVLGTSDLQGVGAGGSHAQQVLFAEQVGEDLDVGRRVIDDQDA
jgi:hypothetical protein